MAAPCPAETAAYGTPRLRRVLSRRRESRDTVTLDLDDAGGPGFEAGQFNMLYAFGQGEVPISMSGDPAAPGRIGHTVRAVGAVTEALTRLQAGSEVGVRGPFGRPWPVRSARGSDVLLVAGGLGLAPLKPAMHALLDDRLAYGRVALVYGARTPADLLFRPALSRWRGRLDVQLEATVDAAVPGWRGDVGVVTSVLGRVAIEPDRTVAMICGPELMMRFAVRALRDRGLGPGSIWVSLERNMQCGSGVCGHCQLGPLLLCRDGPVFSVAELGPYFELEEG